MTHCVSSPALFSRTRCLRKLLAFLPLALVAFNPATLRAQVITSTWIGTVLTATGNWTDSLFWLPPPQPGYNVTINNVLLLPAAVSLDVDATVNQLSLGSGAQLKITNGRKLQLNANSVINGTLLLSSTGSATELLAGNLGVTLSGTGSIIMSANAANQIRGGSSNGFINQLTISGSGTIGDGQMDFTNQGTIIANNAAVPLILNPNATGMINTGTFRATAGATLELNNQTFLNTGGTIVADANSHIDAFNTTIVGGTLTSVGTGHFHATDAIFSGVTITSGSTIELSNGDVMTLLGNVVNDGLISVLATSGSNDLKFDGAVSLSGTGSVVMSDSASNGISAAGVGSVLTIGPAQTLSGAGAIGRNTLGLVNQGTIIANQSNPLILDGAGTSFVNNGVLKASGTGGMTLADSAVSNLGTVDITSGSMMNVAGAFSQTGAASATKLTGGTFTSTGFALQTGSLAGSGTIGGPVTASGNATLVPGGPGAIGALVFTSTLNLGPSTSVYFDLGGTTPITGHDFISATSMTLDGSLFLSFTNGFQSNITPTDTLTLISTSTALNGTFGSLPNGSRLTTLDGFGSFQVNYLPNALTLSNFQPIPEPSTYVLLTIGAFGVLLAERRRRRRAACSSSRVRSD